jgi:hypothetical protein
MSERNAYEEKFAAQLKVWEAEVQKLQAQADKASADVKADYYRRIDELKTHLDEAQKRYQQMVEANTTAWEEFRAQSDAAWQDLADGINAAWNRFR